MSALWLAKPALALTALLFLLCLDLMTTATPDRGSDDAPPSGRPPASPTTAAAATTLRGLPLAFLAGDPSWGLVGLDGVCLLAGDALSASLPVAVTGSCCEAALSAVKVAGAPATLRGLPLGFLTGDAVLVAAVNAGGSGCSMLLVRDASDVPLVLLCALQTISSSTYVNRHHCCVLLRALQCWPATMPDLTLRQLYSLPFEA